MKIKVSQIFRRKMGSKENVYFLWKIILAHMSATNWQPRKQYKCRCKFCVASSYFEHKHILWLFSLSFYHNVMFFLSLIIELLRDKVYFLIKYLSKPFICLCIVVAEQGGRQADSSRQGHGEESTGKGGLQKLYRGHDP